MIFSARRCIFLLFCFLFCEFSSSLLSYIFLLPFFFFGLAAGSPLAGKIHICIYFRVTFVLIFFFSRNFCFQFYFFILFFFFLFN